MTHTIAALHNSTRWNRDRNYWVWGTNLLDYNESSVKMAPSRAQFLSCSQIHCAQIVMLDAHNELRSWNNRAQLTSASFMLATCSSNNVVFDPKWAERSRPKLWPLMSISFEFLRLKEHTKKRKLHLSGKRYGYLWRVDIKVICRWCRCMYTSFSH